MLDNHFKTKQQICDLIKRADDYADTSMLIAKLCAIKKSRVPFYLTKEELNEILRWKLRGQYNRQAVRRTINTDDNIKKITSVAFAVTHDNFDAETILRLKLLCTLDGVALPVGSAILTLCFPSKYSVIDFRNWRQFSGVIYSSKTSYSHKEYLQYLKATTYLANKFDLTPQEIDMALWQLDIERSKR